MYLEKNQAFSKTQKLRMIFLFVENSLITSGFHYFNQMFVIILYEVMT